MKMYEQKHCTLERVLEKEEAEFLRELFKVTLKKIPTGEYVALKEKRKMLYVCEFNYEFGKKAYCNNQIYIREMFQINIDSGIATT